MILLPWCRNNYCSNLGFMLFITKPFLSPVKTRFLLNFQPLKLTSNSFSVSHKQDLSQLNAIYIYTCIYIYYIFLRGLPYIYIICTLFVNFLIMILCVSRVQSNFCLMVKICYRSTCLFECLIVCNSYLIS